MTDHRFLTLKAGLPALCCAQRGTRVTRVFGQVAAGSQTQRERRKAESVTVYSMVLLLLRATASAAAGDRLLRSLPRARIRPRALPAHGQAAAMAQTAIAADFGQAADVQGDLASQIALDDVVL